MTVDAGPETPKLQERWKKADADNWLDVFADAEEATIQLTVRGRETVTGEVAAMAGARDTYETKR